MKIYVTTKYQVKYYLDQGDGNGYQLLGGETWTNPNYYTTPGTENAVKAAEETADYVMTTDPETSYNMNLINQTPTDGTTFKDAKMIRGEYSEFLYKFNTYPHTIPIARLPLASEGEIPTGKSLEAPGNIGEWVIRDAALAQLMVYDESTDLNVTETMYGTGNTVWSYKSAEDNTNTYHLYAKVASPGIRLPRTGGPGTGRCLILGSALTAGAFLLLRRRRRTSGSTHVRDRLTSVGRFFRVPGEEKRRAVSQPVGFRGGETQMLCPHGFSPMRGNTAVFAYAGAKQRNMITKNSAIYLLTK